MSFSVGIVGLPNVGKSTLFKALTKQPVNISNYPFCTIDPNVGIVAVPDKILEKISQIIKPEKTTPTIIEFVDIAGLVKNAHQGEGLGNQFLARIRETDAICQVVRDFENSNVIHIEGQPNPQRDIEIINTELIMKDLETINKRLEKDRKKAKADDKKIIQEIEELEKAKKKLEKGEFVKNEGIIKELFLLTTKPMIYVFNTNKDLSLRGEAAGDDEAISSFSTGLPRSLRSLAMTTSSPLPLNLKLESEISELSPEEQNELELPSSQLNHLIKSCYQALDLITFYTIKGNKETRAWTLKKGLAITKAGKVVHSDFQDKFIRAEVVNCQDLIKVGSWLKCREKGLIRTEGKEYIVQNNDVIEFKI